MNLKKSIKKRIATLSDLMHRLLAPAPQRTYNHVLSLGFNCEVAFQFLKFNGFLESCMWNWYGTESTACLSAALSSFDTVGIDFLPKRESRLWKDSNHALCFHGKGNHRIWKPGADPSLLEADKEELISRMTYLKEKFLQLAKSAESVLFVYKVPEEELKRPDYATSCILELRNALADLGFKHFDLMVIVTHDVAPLIREKLAVLEPQSSIILESIAFHAPITTVTEGPYDIKNWRRIWAAYRSTRPRTQTKKKYKFQQS